MILKSIKEKIPNKFRKLLRQKIKFLYPRIKSETWCLDSIQVNENFLEIKGWAIAPQIDHSKYSFSINNIEFDSVNYPTSREDIAKLYWYLPNAINSGFTCMISVKQKNFFSDGYACFSFIDSETKTPLRSEHNYYCFDITMDKKLPVPDEKRRVRVQGNSSEKVFLLEGFTTFMKLKLTCNKIVGKDFNDFSSILDWGCGCGRLIRYFEYVKDALVTGIDIDPDNIEWCRKYFPFGNFIAISKHPPTSFPDASFDLLIGISVFTHLKEKVQFEWLKELHRIACNDAILLMTIHGQEAIKRSVLSPEFLIPLRIKGFLDVGSNPGLDDIIEGDNYYRNIYHRHRYIESKWSKYFDIIDIIPGYIGNLQDLVVMRKKNII